MSDDINRQIFMEEANELLAELEGALLELEEAPDDDDLVNKVFRCLHTIKGSGAMFGFEDIAEFTHEVETVFDMVRNGELEVTKELINHVFDSRDLIQQMLDLADSAESVDPRGIEIVLTGLNRMVGGVSETAVESEPVVEPEAADEPEPEVELDLTVDVEESEQEPEAVVEAGAPTAVIDVPEVPDFMGGAGTAESESIADEMAVEENQAEESEPEPGEVRGFDITIASQDEELEEIHLDSLFEQFQYMGEFEVQERPDPGANPPLVWKTQLHTTRDLDDVNDVFLFTDLDLQVTVTEVGAAPVVEAKPVAVPDEEFVEPALVGIGGIVGDEAPRLGEILVREGDLKEEDLKDALSKQKPIGEILVEEGKVSPNTIEKAVEKQSMVKKAAETRRRQDAVSSIRVGAEKLDYLVDLVGELVIVQAQITQVVSERNDPTMTVLSEELERLSDELRDSTLGIRMLPIGTTFSKFRRLVRDLSAELGKEITLSTNGAETELDKTVIERLGDPLVHLLRNSIDHGVEQPADRKAMGKPGAGMIMLAAEHSGGEVLIRITDDGRGIDSRIIKGKAVERGLIAEDAELSEKEIFQLIFEPGFSTAESVTSVSGRGVGMDVVKRAIDSLRGTIDIDSVVGKGTTITIRLPLTLAIIDGLQVQVEDEYYVIPLSLVEECVELTNDEENEDEHGQKLLHLRGEIVPYIHIRDWFDIEGNNPPIEQIVITGVEGRRVGIVVDRVIGEHQTVIKSLSRVYKDVEGISGATIKGDGSIALILDVPMLIRRVIREST